MSNEIQKTDNTGLATIGGYDIEKRRKALLRAQENNAGASGPRAKLYDTKGKVVYGVSKTSFEGPEDAPIENAKVFEGIIINFENQLARWKADNETVDPSLLDENGELRGPLCSSVRYEDPDEDDNTSKSGWSPVPFWSAFHAQKVLPGLQGRGGHDGMQGETSCSTCPMAQQGLEKADKLCKPAGRLEVVVLTANKKPLDEPFMAVIKLSPSNVIQYAKYLEAIQKKYARSRDQYVDISNIMTSLAVMKEVSGGKTYGRVEFAPLSTVRAETASVVMEVVQRTREKADAIDAEEDTTPTPTKSAKGKVVVDDDDLPF